MKNLSRITLHFTDETSASMLPEFEYGLTIINPHKELKLALQSKELKETTVIDELYMAIADDAWYNMPKGETVNLVEKLQDKNTTITAITLTYNDKTTTTYNVKFAKNEKHSKISTTSENKYQRIWRDDSEYAAFTYIRISEKVELINKMNELINLMEENF